MILEEIHEMRDLYECVYSAFAGDKDLVDKYHIVGESLDDCVRDTYNKIVEASKDITLEWYAVTDDAKIIGFVVISLAHKVLYSFGLNIKYRQNYSDIMFTEISQLFDSEFICLLWNKNARAIKYLERNGMRIENVDENITKLCL